MKVNAHYMKRSIWFLLAFLVFLPLVAKTAVYRAEPVAIAPAQNQVLDYQWQGYALLKHIASCESTGDPNKEPREFNASGTVLRGYPNPNDVGLAQINIPTWGANAKALGDDLFTYQGNLAFAKWLFDHEGDEPWKYSKGCWGRYAA